MEQDAGIRRPSSPFGSLYCLRESTRANRSHGHHRRVVMTAAASILLLVLLEMMVPAIAGPEEEAAALLAFTHALVADDPHRALAGWPHNSTGAPCSWAGVSCEPQRPVPRRRAPPRHAPEGSGAGSWHRRAEEGRMGQRSPSHAVIWKYERECGRFFTKLTRFLVQPCDQDRTASDESLHACTGRPDCTGYVAFVFCLVGDSLRGNVAASLSRS
jgi:hypothetical protein